MYDIAGKVLGEVRKAKTEAKRSLRAEVEHVLVRDTEARLDALRGALDDLKEAGRVAAVDLEVAPEASVVVTLAPEEA